jgi:hypothetical protein
LRQRGNAKAQRDDAEMHTSETTPMRQRDNVDNTKAPAR